jgi:type IV secretory pathway protease TraF
MLALLAALWIQPVRIGYNNSFSDPHMFCVTWPSLTSSVNLGQQVVVDIMKLPKSQKDVYLKYKSELESKGYHIGKFVAGMPGDIVRVRGDRLTVNQWTVFILRKDYKGLPVASYYAKDGSYPIPEGHIVLLNPGYGSLDSRYIGPVPKAVVVRRAVPIPWLKKHGFKGRILVYQTVVTE